MTGTIFGDVTEGVQSELNHKNQPLSHITNTPLHSVIPRLLQCEKVQALNPPGQACEESWSFSTR